jgi:hypothetical protein
MTNSGYIGGVAASLSARDASVVNDNSANNGAEFMGFDPKVCRQRATEKVRGVIPGRAEGANPESRTAGNPDVTGFRAPAFGRPRNDRGRIFSAAC